MNLSFSLFSEPTWTQTFASLTVLSFVLRTPLRLQGLGTGSFDVLRCTAWRASTRWWVLKRCFGCEKTTGPSVFFFFFFFFFFLWGDLAEALCILMYYLKAKPKNFSKRAVAWVSWFSSPNSSGSAGRCARISAGPCRPVDLVVDGVGEA